MTASTTTTSPRLRIGAFLLLAVVLCLAADCLLYWDCLGVGKTILGHDTRTHDYGMLMWAWGRARETGALPLWNPYLFGGIPMLGSIAMCPFTPPAALFLILPFPLAFTLQYLFAFVAGGVGMALLARRLGVSTVAALACGVLFCLSGHLTTLAHAGHQTKALAFCWVPWLFAAGEWWFDRPGWRRAAALGVPLALMIVASHLQILCLAVMFFGLWIAGKAIGARLWRRPRLVALMIGQLAFACVLAGMLGAAQLLPVMEMKPLSNRVIGVSAEEAARTSYPPEELIEFIRPGFFGGNWPGSATPYRGRWGAPMAERIVSDYFGLLALIVALGALAIGRRKGRWIWAAIAVGGVWLGLGRFAGLHHILRAVLPGYAAFRSPAVALGWTTAGALVLTAFGLDELLSLLRRRIKNHAVSGCIIAVLALLMAADVYHNSRRYVAPDYHANFMRYLATGAPPAAVNDPRKPVRIFQRGHELDNLYMNNGIGSLHGYHPIVYLRYQQVVEAVDWFSLKAATLFHQNWLVIDPATPAPNGWKARQMFARGLLCERIDDTPYILFPDNAVRADSVESAVARLGDPAFDPAREAVVETAADTAMPVSGNQPTAVLIDYGLDRVEFTATLDAPRVAVFCDLMAPGWRLERASAPNAGIKTFYANAGFRGAVLPAGEGRYAWVYSPFSFRLGAYLSFAALAALLAFVLAGNGGARSSTPFGEE